jgi:hypothetical protein
MAAVLGKARLGRTELGRANEQASGNAYDASFLCETGEDGYFFAELGAVDVTCIAAIADGTPEGLHSSPLRDPSHSY